MTASEIVMKREDVNIAWGFRLTGGADLGTPFFVVKVLGRGAAERAGLKVGDMVYAINQKYINTYSHKDAQNVILHTGDTLVLNIRRGPFSGRGTPLPEYADPLMGLIAPPPYEPPELVPLPPYEPPPMIIREPTPPESEDEPEEPEETVAAFTVKMNPKGRIAAIEELPVTPPPSRSSSRCRSRSRSASRDHSRSRKTSVKREALLQNRVGNGNGGVEKVVAPATNTSENVLAPGLGGMESRFVPGPGGRPGPGESFTYSKEVLTQYSTVLSAAEQLPGQTSEMVNESFIIHGGSQHKMEDILSPEDIERDIFEEKMEEQKIQELLTGEAELLEKGIVGINFQKIIPRTDFIKDSDVFKELQDQRIRKEEPEEVQLEKDPTKRFSTFLQAPKRTVPRPKPKTLSIIEDLPWRQRTQQQNLPPQQVIEKNETVQCQETTESTSTWSEKMMSSQLMENMEEGVCIQELQQYKKEYYYQEMTTNGENYGPIITEAVSSENISDEKAFLPEEPTNGVEDVSNEEEIKAQEADAATEVPAPVENEPESCDKPKYKSEFERQLDEIRKQMEAIQQLPSVLLANLSVLQVQLDKIVEAKAANDQNQIDGNSSRKSSNTRSQLSLKMDTAVENGTDHCEEANTIDGEILIQEGDVEREVCEEVVEGKREEITELEDTEVAETIQNGLDEYYENMKNQELNNREREDDESSVAKPPILRKFPHNIAERPIVLPGGRKWYKPRDAYNEDFIAETIIHQSEVLVGTTIGMNFLKYEPPKFDAKNSSVYRLVREMEEKSNGGTRLPIETRPEKVLAEDDYFPPISKRHFFAARLTEQIELPENVDKILLDNSAKEISV